MHPSFGPSPRKKPRAATTSSGNPLCEAAVVSAARARTTALLAAGLFGAAALVVMPSAAHAQNTTGGINIPRVAPYLPADAPQQLIDQDYKLRYLNAVAAARKQASRNAALVPLRVAYQVGIGGQPYRRYLVSQGALGIAGGQVKAAADAIAQRDGMPVLSTVGSQGKAAGSSAAANTSSGSASLMALGSTRINIGNTQGLWAFSGPQFLNPPESEGLGTQDVIGRVNGISYDPNSGKLDAFGNAAPEVFYVATSNGGVWRYTQGSNHPTATDPNVLSYGPWEVLSDYSFPNLSTTCVAVNPTNSRNIFVGTGDYPAQLGTSPGYGIMRSVDGGKTWLNVGQNLSGTAVSAIVINPENPQELVATTGRGVVSGFVWRSTDGGNNWNNVSPLNATNNPIAGNWSSVDFGALPPSTVASTLNPNHNRVYYATCENVGVFRSVDRGATWQRIDQNINNGSGLVYNTKVTPTIGGFGLQVSASKLPYQNRFPAQRNTQAPTIAQGPDIVYVIDSAAQFNDGKIYKSLDLGETWTDITGTFPTNVTNTANGVIDNNWFLSDYALRLRAATLPLTDFTVQPNPLTGLFPTRTQEGLYGSGRTFSGTRGGVSLDGANFLYTLSGDLNNPTITPTLFDLGASGLWTDISQSLGFNGAFSSLTPQAHRDFHDTQVSPNDNSRVVVANDGGVNRFIYSPGYANSSQTADYVFLGDSAWTLDPEPLNSQLGIALVEKGDFIQTSPTHYRYTGDISNNLIFTGDLDFTSAASPNLQFATSSFTPFYPIGSSNVIVPDVPVGANPNGVPSARNPALYYNYYGNSSIFDKYDATGQSLYISTDYRGNWPFRRLYYTRDDFANYQDITPDRFLTNNGDRSGASRDANGRTPLYVYNTIDPGDSATATNWQGEVKPQQNQNLAMAVGLAGFVPHRVFVSPQTVPEPNPNNGLFSVMYVGAQYLWRFDPPGIATVPRLPGATAPGTGPNPDYGIWRRVGGTQLASGNDYVTAIAVNENSQSGEGDVIYVGTNEGKLWVLQKATNHSQAVPLPALNSAWKQLGGQGSNNLTLPNAVAGPPPRAVTSISINTDPQSATFGDVLVGYANPNSRFASGGLFRGANVLGPQGGLQPVFTGQTGQGFASLPNSSINEIVRDPDDPTNTIFVATDIGVFATTNGGATWVNATAPLGLPNVQCTSLKIVGTSDVNNSRFLMVSTYGRGMFRFDLNNLKIATQPTKLTFTPTFTRSGTQIIVNLTIANSGATAQNVKITGASLKTDTGVSTQTIATLPVTVGSVGAGQSTTISLRFPATVGRAGTAVTFFVNGSYTVPPFPPGTTVTFDNKPGVRTRLP